MEWNYCHFNGIKNLEYLKIFDDIFVNREDDIVVPPPKLKLKEVMSAMLDVVERGGREVVRVR